MTRKDFEIVCKVLKQCHRLMGTDADALEVVSMVSLELCEAFELTGEARKLFLERAGVTATVTTARN